MSRIRSELSHTAVGIRLLPRVLASAVLLAVPVVPVSAQDAAPIRSSEFSVSGTEAALRLGLAGDRTLDIAIRDGGVFIDGQRVGSAARGSELDGQWRALLTQAMDVSPTELPQLLTSWSASGGAGSLIDSALENALAPADALQPAAAPASPITDSVSRLLDRIGELEQTVEALEDQRPARVVVQRPQRRSRGPLHYIMDGIGGIFSLLVTYVVLFAIGVAVIFFGGRKYIEGVADTARHATGRSLMVGMAAAFLVIPAFVLGMIALVISIIGIPGLLIWVPAFPLAVVLSVLLGYLGVAHAAGEAFAERRFYVTDWFERGNSYYFLLSGLGLLLALFLAGMVVHMAGPWLQAIKGILFFLGVVTTITAVIVGFGAVLISRGGTRPSRNGAAGAEQDLFTEDAGV